ncbi:MAG: tetratricopeptide repeat protein [Candidatus Eremiobacteraeota bacterium]|nr:tetratricopeptide repeat protein [Candidatus Eremiobacteraeota bacterium]
MKRFALAASFALALGIAFLATPPTVDARGPAATPTPTPTPAALPTPSPEPPSVAIPRLQARLKANPNDQDAMIQLAYQFLGISRPDLAIQLTQQLIKLGNKSAQVYAFDGSAFQALGQVDRATADFEQASTIDPTNLGVLSQLTNLYVQTNRLTDAERVAKRALTFNKTEPQALQNMGLVYASEGHFDDARVQYEAAALLAPKDVQPIVQIANTYNAQNNIPMALQTIDRALKIDPANVQVLVYKADLYGKQHDDAHVGQAFDDAVVAAPTDDQKVAILVRKAAYYIDSKKNPIAEAILTDTEAKYPKVAASHVAYGDFLAQNKQLPRAQAEWKTALGIDKENPQALLRMGQSSLSNGRYSDALGYLKHYTTISPDAQGFAMLGQVYSFVHDYARSRVACSSSFQIQRSPETLSCVAGADYELKNYKEASQIFDALDISAKGFLDANPQMLFIAAKSYEKTKQNAKALADYKRLLPMTKKGSKEYKLIAGNIAALTKKK